MKEFIKGGLITCCFSIMLFLLVLKVNNIDSKMSETEIIYSDCGVVLIDTIHIHNKTHEIIRYYQGAYQAGIIHSPECWCNDKKIYE